MGVWADSVDEYGDGVSVAWWQVSSLAVRSLCMRGAKKAAEQGKTGCQAKPEGLGFNACGALLCKVRIVQLWGVCKGCRRHNMCKVWA
jgi:hypothetical protein